jgi:hypothetical protein
MNKNFENKTNAIAINWQPNKPLPGRDDPGSCASHRGYSDREMPHNPNDFAGLSKPPEKKT